MSEAIRVLAVNVGSSSLKLDVWEAGGSRALVRLEARGIGREQGSVAADDVVTVRRRIADHDTALALLLQRVPAAERLERIGHRFVHGGSRYHVPTWLDDEVVQELQALVPLSPLHLPPALTVIDSCRRRFPGIAQAAVFDTAFHAALPPRAFTYAVPARWRAAGVRRYGFHGIACADVVMQLGEALRERAVILHLGAGCSATAVLGGKSIDTTMGFTPLEGLVMATRGGDIDPGALVYVQRELGLTPQELEQALNEQGGLLALSESSADMRELLQRQDERAALAVEVFCYRAAKAVGSLAVALGGMEQLIFSGGIGEHSAAVRERIGALLRGMDVVIDMNANRAHAPVISSSGSGVEVRVMAVDEGRQIARETMQLRDGH
ncbi:MAG: acetate/propionate family kinase [Gammaproteobacteria bacterium]